eukprot:CAMPEP_0119007876 /NCGR_PEP_ID=MMETSP1176-20130426/3314_1 /TAXON_ID=265551 /ORGANISM="Synedropsis recta cf, Strain CCMP1620" /LENGTH=430 /DNA_ID=CAMNT_0006960109 /DNA_START=71 /DNA_END=1363 /DNA_ORIENTATION=-
MCRSTPKCPCQNDVHVESTNFLLTNSSVMNGSSQHQQQQHQQQRRRVAQIGDIVTIDFSLRPENGYVPHPLFDTSGKEVTFVLGWGNYLPGLHALIEGMTEGESIDDDSNSISIDAGWGKRRQDLIVTVPRSNSLLLPKSSSAETVVGSQLTLKGSGNIQVLVTAVTDTTITVDANPPLAGSSYSCQSLTIKSISSLPTKSVRHGYGYNDDDGQEITTTKDEASSSESSSSEPSPSSNNNKYQVATFGLGCFWGAQLAFSRVPGVVGTKAGYTQGKNSNKNKTVTYEQVSQGTSRHVEAVSVVYDATLVSYEQLLAIAMERLEQQETRHITSTSSWNEYDLAWLFGSDDDNDDDDDTNVNVQYRHGFYFHTAAQKQLATDFVSRLNNARYRIELRPATTFDEAEEYHQHYLLKGGQSARKGAKETIRCFG